jgi:hypothetical protein
MGHSSNLRRSGGSPSEILMHPSRALGRSALVLLAGLTVAACATTTPLVRSTAPSASTANSAFAASPSTLLSGASAPVDSAQPAESPQPTSSPDPTGTRTLEPIAGCGTGEAGFAAHGAEGPRSLRFGGATIEFTSAGTGMLDGSYDVDDAIPGGVGLTANEIGVVVGPGDHIILRAAGLKIVDTTAQAVPWSKVTFGGGLATLGGPRTALTWRVRADGSLSVSAPTEIGDWAVEFLPRWQGDCTKGDGTAYARIKVR